MTVSHVADPVDSLIAFLTSIRFAGFVFHFFRCGYYFNIFGSAGVFTQFHRINCGMTESYVVQPVDFLIAFQMSIRFAGLVFSLVRCGHFLNIFSSV